MNVIIERWPYAWFVPYYDDNCYSLGHGELPLYYREGVRSLGVAISIKKGSVPAVPVFGSDISLALPVVC